VNKEIVSAADLKRYKSILNLTSAHLEGYEPGARTHISKGIKFKTVIAKLFPQTKQRDVETALRQQWERLALAMISRLYYDPSKPSAFSTVVSAPLLVVFGFRLFPGYFSRKKRLHALPTPKGKKLKIYFPQFLPVIVVSDRVGFADHCGYFPPFLPVIV
jgi:hypothetical protein